MPRGNDDQPPLVEFPPVPPTADGPFPAETEFFDVEGVPVVLLRGEAIVSCRAYDPGPRSFPIPAVLRNGTPITESAWRALVEDCRREGG